MLTYVYNDMIYFIITYIVLIEIRFQYPKINPDSNFTVWLLHHGTNLLRSHCAVH